MTERVFSTSIDAEWSFVSTLEPSSYTNAFNKIKQITLDYFSNHDSPSVQNTLYRMGERILNDMNVIWHY
jgi:urate oxidase